MASLKSDARLMGGFFLLAALLRIGLWFALPNTFYIDGNNQVLEQAYRLLTGRGLIPWEYQIGARSWLLPGLVAPFMALPMALSDRPEVMIRFVHAVIALGACAVVPAAYAIARPLGRAPALWAAGLNTVWSENLYFAPQFEVDNPAAILLIAALAVAMSIGADDRRPWRWVLAGLLFGLALTIRVQLAPAIAVAILGTCGLRMARLIPLCLGFAVPLLALGLADWISWGMPFSSVSTYLLVNSSGVSQAYGVSPWWNYLWYQARFWTIGVPLLALTVCLGAARRSLPALVAAAVLLTFTLISHKEYRFVYPATPLLITLAGIGSARLLELARPRSVRLATLLLGGAWLICVTAGLLGPELRPLFLSQVATFQAFRAINADARACGVGIDNGNENWRHTGAHRLRRDLSMFTATPDTAEHDKGAYNVILAVKNPDAARQYAPFGYGPVLCPAGSEACVLQRPGGCDASVGDGLRAITAPAAKAALERLGFEVY